jgi:hypothetical protein
MRRRQTTMFERYIHADRKEIQGNRATYTLHHGSSAMQSQLATKRQTRNKE